MNTSKKLDLNSIPSLSVMDAMTQELSKKIAQTKDSEIHQLLTELESEYQPLEILAKRCRFVRRIGANYQTLLFDERPVMEIYDLEFSMEDGKATASFQTRRLA